MPAGAEIFVPEQKSTAIEPEDFKHEGGSLTGEAGNITHPDRYILNQYNDPSLLIAARGKVKAARKAKREKSETKDTTDYMSIAVKGAYLTPLGDWKEIIKPGYGGILEICLADLFFEGFSAGIESGYMYAPGKADGVKSEYIVPAYAALAYQIPLFWEIGIVPKISGGGAYFSLSEKGDAAGNSPEKKTEFEPVAAAGLTLTCDISEYVAIEAGGEYGMIFEKDGRLPFVVTRFGLSFSF